MCRFNDHPKEIDMSSAIRFYQPGVPQLIISQTNMNQAFMPDTPQVKELLGGILSKLCWHYRIKLHAFIFLPNEFRLIAAAPADRPCDLADFMRDLKSAIACKLASFKAKVGPFFNGRYQAIPILDQPSLIEQVEAIHALAYAQDAASFNGLSSEAEYRGVKRSFRYEEKCTVKRGQETLKESKVYKYRLGVFLVAGVKAKKIREKKDPLSRSRRVSCFAKDEQIEAKFLEERGIFRTKFATSSGKLRLGDVCNALFPPNSYKPKLKADWRIVIFPEEQEQAIWHY